MPTRKFTTPIELPADAANAMEAVPKQQLDAGLAGKQTADTDLSAIAALSPADNDVLQRKSGAWTSRTLPQLKSDLAYTASDVGAQASDADLATIAALDSGTAGALVTDGAGWIRKTYAQLKTALSLVKADVGLGNVDNTSDADKPVSTAQQTALDGKQPLDATLTAFAALAIASGKLAYGTGTDTFALADLTAAGRALLDDADASAQLTTLGVSTFIKTLLDDADASTALSTLGFSTFIKTLVDDADAATARTTLGVAHDGTATLSNKRITKRAGSAASTSSLTYDSDSYDVYTLTALAAALTLPNPSGTPTDGQPLLLRIKDNGSARGITWSGAQWRALGVTLPTTTTVSKWLVILAVWQVADSRWDVLHVGLEA